MTDPVPKSGPTSRRARTDPAEGVAALTGSGASIVGVEGALRAHDVSRPTEADLAEAEALPVLRANRRPGEE